MIEALFAQSGAKWHDDATIDAWWIEPGEEVVVIGTVGPVVHVRSTGEAEGDRDAEGPRSMLPGPDDGRLLVAFGPPYDTTP